MGRLVSKTLDGLEILGFSLAGEESVIAAPELNTCFDVGRAPREIVPIDHVCLSHGHMDHAAGVAYYFSQRNFIGCAPGRVIVDLSLAQPLQRLMAVWADIEGHHSPGEILGVEPLEDVPIRRDLLVRPFRVNHAAGALGFTLVEVRHKLKEELLGKTGPQLVALKNEGVAIEERIEISRLTFTGDTALGRFLDHDFVRQTRVLIVECTFFERDHRARARAGRHIHVDDMPAILEAVPDAKVMITHLTRRTDLRAAKRTLAGMLSSSDMDRISFLMERVPRKPRRQDTQAPE